MRLHDLSAYVVDVKRLGLISPSQGSRHVCSIYLQRVEGMRAVSACLHSRCMAGYSSRNCVLGTQDECCKRHVDSWL